MRNMVKTTMCLYFTLIQGSDCPSPRNQTPRFFPQPRLAAWGLSPWYFVYTCWKLRKKSIRMIPLKPCGQLKTWPNIPMEVETDESAVLHRKISKRVSEKVGGHERHWRCMSRTDSCTALSINRREGFCFCQNCIFFE